MREVLVVGDVILDKYMRVKTRGVSPENSAVLVVNEQSVTCNLGGAANVARCVKTLGGDPLLLGFSGSDVVGLLCHEGNVRHDLSPAASGSTPTKTRIVTADGHYLLRVDVEPPFFGMPDAWWNAGGGQVAARFKRSLFGPVSYDKPVVCLVDYDKGCLTRAAARCLMYHVASVHESFKFPVIVDPGRNGGWEKYGSPRTIFRANLRQAMQHFVRVADRHGTRAPYEAGFDVNRRYSATVYSAVLRAVQRNLAATGTEYAYVVLTLGPGGLIVGNRADDMWQYCPAPADAVDPCGAGDVVTAAMAVVLAGEADPLAPEGVLKAVVAARDAAAVAVRKPGVYAVTEEDMGWSETRA